MRGFDRRRRLGLDDRLRFVGLGSMAGAMFDLGLYPAAVASPDGRVRGEVFEVADGDGEAVLSALDRVEGFDPASAESSLYVRQPVAVHLDDGTEGWAWAYLYNAPLGAAPRIVSGDYRAHLGGTPRG